MLYEVITYFEQYESWRDKAMTEASKHLSLDQDVVIITMDFRRFYYSVDMDEAAFNKMFNDANIDEIDDNFTYLKRLNKFVCDVIKTYSIQFDSDEYKERHVLPIGFLPSNVIANRITSYNVCYTKLLRLILKEQHVMVIIINNLGLFLKAVLEVKQKLLVYVLQIRNNFV